MEGAEVTVSHDSRRPLPVLFRKPCRLPWPRGRPLGGVPYRHLTAWLAKGLQKQGRWLTRQPEEAGSVASAPSRELAKPRVYMGRSLGLCPFSGAGVPETLSLLGSCGAPETLSLRSWGHLRLCPISGVVGHLETLSLPQGAGHPWSRRQPFSGHPGPSGPRAVTARPHPLRSKRKKTALPAG